VELHDPSGGIQLVFPRLWSIVGDNPELHDLTGVKNYPAKWGKGGLGRLGGLVQLRMPCHAMPIITFALSSITFSSFPGLHVSSAGWSPRI